MLLFGWWVGCWLGMLVSRVCVFAALLLWLFLAVLVF